MRLKTIIILIIIINFVIFSSYPVIAEDNNDIIYFDQKGDIEFSTKYDTIMVTGHKNIDILKIKSHIDENNQNIILEMKVAGIIVDSEQISYNFYLMVEPDEDYPIYNVEYNNSECTGYNPYWESEEPDIKTLETSGQNTDTLKITIPLENVDYNTNFDLECEAIEKEESLITSDYYRDSCPDWFAKNPYGRLISITEPTNGSTIFKTCIIKGMTSNLIKNKQKVEVQIDSKSSTDWVLASTSNNWSTWDFNWDTQSVYHGKHTITARIYDGEDYFYDEIVVYIDQQSVLNPIYVNLPDFHIGDKYEYQRIYYYYPGMTEDETITNSYGGELLENDSIIINGTEYDTYVFKTKTEFEINDGDYYYKSTSEGTKWLRKSDLAMVKTDRKEDFSGGGDVEPFQGSQHIISIFDPPDNKYKFPLIVGDKWEVSSNVTHEITHTVDGKTEINKENYLMTYECECLRNETISLFGENFEVFIIHYNFNYNFEENDSYFFSVYDIEYYSPELGYPLKIESYNEYEEYKESIELITYRYGNKSYQPPDEKPSNQKNGFKVSVNLILFILFIIILIVIIVMVIKKRNIKKLKIKNQINDSKEEKSEIK